MKKIVCFMIAIASLFAILAFPTNAAYYTNPQRWGFNIDSEIYGSVGKTANELVQTVYYKFDGKDVLIGTTSTTVFFTSQREKPAPNKVVNVALFYTVITPFQISKMLLGTSDLLTVSASLPKSNQTNISHSPKNDPDEKAYTVGVELGYGKDGLSAGINASTTITKKNLTITNKSNQYLKKHSIEYDYKHLLISNNNYLLYESEQRSVFCYETDGNPFTFPVTVSVRFGTKIPGFGFFGNLDFVDNVANQTTTWGIGIN